MLFYYVYLFIHNSYGLSSWVPRLPIEFHDLPMETGDFSSTEQAWFPREIVPNTPIQW